MPRRLALPSLLTILVVGCVGAQTPTSSSTAPASGPTAREAPLAVADDAPGGSLVRPISAALAAEQRGAAGPAIKALRAGQFKRADKLAAELVEQEPDNSYAQLVRAIASYRVHMHQLSLDVRTVVFGGAVAGGFNHRYMRSSLEQALAALAEVDQALAVASSNPAISLELCLACWEIDWNNNRRVDEFDRLLFQIEQDAHGNPIPDDDPRRKPTFRFDRGDVDWARAFVSFQRAVLELLLAYDWGEVDKLLDALDGREPKRLVLRLGRPEGVARARQLILDGLRHSAESRRHYLGETDDDREWIPNPRQQEHPLPLPVDDALYQTWGAVLDDLEQLVQGDHGLSVAELAQLGDHQWENPPGGYLDIGAMLRQPKDIVLELDELERSLEADDVEAALRSLLGTGYAPHMTPSPLIGRLSRMKGEVERGEESLERKLRYLVWIN